MELRHLDRTAISGKTVIVRVDFNVPLEKKGGTQNAEVVVADDNRLRQALETISFLRDHRAKVLLISHLGRPKNEPDLAFSLKPIASALETLLHSPVGFIDNCVGDDVKKQVEKLKPGQVVILENLRFYPGEKQNDPTFSRQLAELADVYVNEAFSTSHRAHASIVGITAHLPSYAGFAFAKEVETFNQLMTKPKRPFVMVIGGAKISDKVAAVEHLTKIADAVLVGGGVANNFLKADGFEIANSYLQDAPADLKKQGVDYVEVAEELIEETKQNRMIIDGYIPLPKIIYPIDVIAAPTIESTKGELIELVNADEDEELKNRKKRLMYLDIGPKTIKLFTDVLEQAGTIFWNGPMGVFENETFANGTTAIAKVIAQSKATTILGGGDTIAAVRAHKLEDRYDYISAAGGAALDYLSGKTLPGVEPLLVKSHHPKHTNLKS